VKKKLLFLESSWTAIIVFGFLLIPSFNLFVNYFPKYFYNSYFEIFSTKEFSKATSVNPITPDITSAVISTISDGLGPIIAIIAAYLTFIAFWTQYKANNIQINYVRQQRFEDTFFRLLDIHKRNVDSMDIRATKDATRVKATGNECFQWIYKRFKKETGSDKSIINIKNNYDKIQDFYKHDLHHYYRFLYHILKFIKSSEISETDKFKYSSILRATLSAYELEMIFHNGLHEHGTSHFKPLIEYFSFLKNMDESLLFNKDQKKGYHKLAFAPSSQRDNLLIDWLTKNAQYNNNDRN